MYRLVYALKLCRSPFADKSFLIKHASWTKYCKFGRLNCQNLWLLINFSVFSCGDKKLPPKLIKKILCHCAQQSFVGHLTSVVHLAKDLWRNGRNTPKNCIFWKYIKGGSYYTPGLGWFFGTWAFIILKSSYQDLSNEESKIFLSSLELVF